MKWTPLTATASMCQSSDSSTTEQEERHGTA
jgi:hypothetical protein